MNVVVRNKIFVRKNCVCFVVTSAKNWDSWGYSNEQDHERRRTDAADKNKDGG